jgi:putative addiction module component (TIGR02574 family)
VAATIEKLVRDALTLSNRDRAELAHKLLVSLEDVAEENVDEAWDIEIGKRVDRIKEGTAKGRPAEEAFKDIRARYQ